MDWPEKDPSTREHAKVWGRVRKVRKHFADFNKKNYPGTDASRAHKLLPLHGYCATSSTNSQKLKFLFCFLTMFGNVPRFPTQRTPRVLRGELASISNVCCGTIPSVRKNHNQIFGHVGFLAQNFPQLEINILKTSLGTDCSSTFISAVPS